MTGPSPRQRLRAALRERRFIAAPGACDPFTARIIEQAGCEAIYLGGNAMAVARGNPQPLLTLDDTVDCTLRVVRTVDVPVIVDLGSGFGEAAHVFRAVRDVEAAGAAAIHIDDQPYPKQFSYHRSGGSGGIVPPETAARRLRAAVEARRDPDLLIIARTDIWRKTGSVEDVIARGRIYQAAGIDALMVLDLRPDQVSQVQAALPDLPLVWIGAVEAPVPTASEISSGGFWLAVYPINTIAAIGSVVAELWGDFQATGVIRQDDALLRRMRPGLQKIVGIETYWDLEDNVSGPDTSKGTVQ